MIEQIREISTQNKKEWVAFVAIVCLTSLAGIRMDLVLILAGIVAGIVLFANPTWAFALLIVAIIFNSILPPVVLPVVNVALTWANIIGLLAFVGLVWDSRLRREQLFWNKSLTFMLLFVVWVWISVSWAQDLRDALVRAVAWSFFLLFYVAFVNFLRKPTHQTVSMTLIAVAGWVLIVIGFVSVAIFGVENRDFVFGLNPNNFSNRLVFAIVGVFWVAFLNERRELKNNPQLFVPTLYLVSTLILVAYSASRGEFISVFIFLALIVLLPGNRQKRFMIFIMALAAVALMWFTTDIWQGLIDRFGSDDTLGGRTGLWDLSWQIFRQNPIIGVGVGSAQQALGIALGIEEGKSPHNPLLLVLLDTGLVGMSLYLMMILTPLLAFSRKLIRNIKMFGMNAIPYRYWLVLVAFMAYLVSWGKSGGSQHDIALYFFLALFSIFASESRAT
ncbi:MAG: O-antigen ligase family protein [Anaerolineales bacterium]|nr:O-antigen ligase family protein [Anaerolineales bacterium]